MLEPTMTIRLFAAHCNKEKMVSVLRSTQGRLRTEKDAAMADLDMSVGTDGHIRIEDVHRERGLWLVNFGRGKEGAAPMKYSPKRKSEEVEFDPDQMPGKEAAALYAPETGHMLIEQCGTLFGMNPIRDYFNWIDGTKFLDLDPEVNRETDNALQRGGKIGNLNFSIAPQAFSSLGLDGPIPTPLSQAVEMGREMGAHRLSVVFSASRGSNLNKRTALQATRKLLGILRRSESDENASPAILGLKANMQVIGDPDEKMQMLDFISRKMEEQVPMDRVNHRFPLANRYRALISTHAKWKPMLESIQMS